MAAYAKKAVQASAQKTKNAVVKSFLAELDHLVIRYSGQIPNLSSLVGDVRKKIVTIGGGGTKRIPYRALDVRMKL